MNKETKGKNPFSINLRNLDDLDAVGGIWMDLSGPGDDELISLSSAAHLQLDELRDCLDFYENARFEENDEYDLVIMRVPVLGTTDRPTPPTLPVGIFIHNNGKIFTVHPDEVKMARLISNLSRKNIQLSDQTDLFFTLLNAINASFVYLLRKKEAQINNLDIALLKRLGTQAIEEVFDLNRTLVYLNTSILSNLRTIRELKRSSYFQNNPEIEEKIEDVEVDIEQMYQTSNIYRDILRGVSDSFNSIMSSHTNKVIRFLTILSLILMVPTLITSFYGMNVDLPFFDFSTPYGGLIIGLITVLLTVGIYFVIRKLRWF